MKGTQSLFPDSGAHSANLGGSMGYASRHQLSWLCFLILSLAYELPLLELTSMDRVNPRLFDVATILGLLFILPTLRRSQPLPRAFVWWKRIVLWFTFCAVIWALAWLPWQQAGQYSLFFAARYLQGLFVIYLAMQIPLSPSQKRVLHYTVVAGGIFVALYAIPEYIRGDTVRHIAGGKSIHYVQGTVLGPLGSTYGHITGWSSMAFAMSLALLGSIRRGWSRWLPLVIAVFVAWPASASGSRTGLLAIALIVVGALIYIPQARSKFLFAGIAALLVITVYAQQSINIEDLRSSSRSVERLLATEESGRLNTIAGRIGIGSDNIQGYSIDMYEWQGARLPLFGGGFYAVPHLRNGGLVYRVGYGIHNGYLFPLEQGGLMALILFIGFLVICFKKLRQMKRSHTPEDAAFAIGVWLFFLVMLVRLWFGTQIWQGAGMLNFSTFVVLILTLACRPTGVYPAVRRN